MRAGFLLLIAGVATAGPSGDRVETMARIDDTVHAIATTLQTDSPKMIDDATAQGKTMRGLLTELSSIKGTDSRAADVLAHYPKYADAVDAALLSLAKLTTEVHRADGLSDRCAKDDKSLHDLLAQKAAKPAADPAKDVDALTKKANALKATWQPILTDLATVDAAVTADTAKTRLGLTDGWWMSIATNLNTLAGAAAATWTEQYQDATGACEQLGRGTEREDVAPVLAELRKKGAANVAAAGQVVLDYNAWLASVRELRGLALEHRERIHEALCHADDSTIDTGAGSIAGNGSRELADRVASTTAEMTRIKGRAGDNAGKSKAILDGIKANGAILASIGHAEALGRDNPKLHAVMAEIHKRRDHAIAGAACANKSVSVAATDCGGVACTIDCVKIVEKTCTLVEAFPDGADSARNDAFARGKRELAALQTWYGRDKASLFTRASATKKCETKTGLELFTDVVTYPACSAAPASAIGESLADVTADLPKD
ncbi:MAG: hypothetical protein QM831_13115 [Kofleriaceae bacterium]